METIEQRLEKLEQKNSYVVVLLYALLKARCVEAAVDGAPCADQLEIDACKSADLLGVDLEAREMIDAEARRQVLKGVGHAESQ
ncbi:hypothetical protein [Kistimonas asteriae]|uniref:hypothetical protein n=1 Tax=Kistimonas asteriae TaxID=517724 RepID=UPI001BABD385|nr:hypothetical protein [Kistimonas asteriae]